MPEEPLRSARVRCGNSCGSGVDPLKWSTMPKRQERGGKSKSQPLDALKGWQQIAAFLGEPTSVVQRWASEGMPVRKQGRYVETTPDELNAWLGKESGKPVHVATENTDFSHVQGRCPSTCETFH
jgi:hypothetical protein